MIAVLSTDWPNHVYAAIVYATAVAFFLLGGWVMPETRQPRTRKISFCIFLVSTGMFLVVYGVKRTDSDMTSYPHWYQWLLVITMALSVWAALFDSRPWNPKYAILLHDGKKERVELLGDALLGQVEGEKKPK